MKTRYLVNIVLLVVVLLLLWLAQQSRQQQQIIRLPVALSQQAVNEIVITRAQRETITLSKVGTGWQLVSPFAAHANSTRINFLLTMLDSQIHSHFKVLNDDNLPQFGLAPAQITIRFNNETFALGNTETISGRRYILYQDMIYLIDDDISPMLSANAASFIDNRLFAAEEQLEAINLPTVKDSELQADTAKLSLVNGQWQSSDDGYTTDQLTATALAWQNAYAMQVNHLSHAQMAGLNGSQLHYKLVDEPQAQTLLVETQADVLLITNPTTQLQYQFPAAMLQQLFLQKSTGE